MVSDPRLSAAIELACADRRHDLRGAVGADLAALRADDACAVWSPGRHRAKTSRPSRAMHSTRSAGCDHAPQGVTFYLPTTCWLLRTGSTCAALRNARAQASALRAILPARTATSALFADHVVGERRGRWLLWRRRAAGLPALIAKRTDAPYDPASLDAYSQLEIADGRGCASAASRSSDALGQRHGERSRNPRACAWRGARQVKLTNGGRGLRGLTARSRSRRATFVSFYEPHRRRDLLPHLARPARFT